MLVDPTCLYCPDHRPMIRLDNVTGPSLYGLVPLTGDQAIQTGVTPKPVVVFQCPGCRLLVLFDAEVGADDMGSARAVAEEVSIGLMQEQLQSTMEQEDFLDSPGE